MTILNIRPQKSRFRLIFFLPGIVIFTRTFLGVFQNKKITNVKPLVFLSIKKNNLHTSVPRIIGFGAVYGFEISRETPHMIIFGKKTVYFGTMKPGNKKKTQK